MKKLLTTILIGGVIFLTCKKSEETTQPETKKNLDQQTAQVIAPAVAEGTSEMFSSFFNPEDFSSLYLMQLGILTPPCVTVSGDTTDADGDGYVKNATFDFNCNYQGPDYTLTMTGTVTVQDDDDNDPTSGFYVDINNFTFNYSGIQTISWTMDATYDLNKTQTGWNGHIEYSFSYNNVSWSWTWDFIYEPDDPNTPYGGGTFNFEGNYNVSYQNYNYSLTVKGTNIHYSEYSSCKYPDSGTLTVTDGTNNLVITFNCDSYTAEYNGIPVAASN